MANKDAAFGLRPIGKVGQNADNNGLSEYQIAASSDAIYQNDPVKTAATGKIVVAGAGGAILGSLNGVFFTDASTGKPTYANHLAASNTATDIVGFVSDDPYQRFEIQCNSTANQADVFLNGDITYAAGSSPNFVSGVELNKATVTTDADVTLKIVGISKDPDNNDTASANVNLVVSVNEHDLAKGSAGI